MTVYPDFFVARPGMTSPLLDVHFSLDGIRQVIDVNRVYRVGQKLVSTLLGGTRIGHSLPVSGVNPRSIPLVFPKDIPWPRTSLTHEIYHQ
jgi:hypothetical protein